MPGSPSTIATGLITLSAHVVVRDECFTDGHAPELLREMQASVTESDDTVQATFQLEAHPCVTPGGP